MKGQPIQVATLLTVIGEEAKGVSSTFNDWVADGDDKKIRGTCDYFLQNNCSKEQILPRNF